MLLKYFIGTVTSLVFKMCKNYRRTSAHKPKDSSRSKQYWMSRLSKLRAQFLELRIKILELTHDINVICQPTVVGPKQTRAELRLQSVKVFNRLMRFSDPGYSERHRYLKNLVSGLRDTVQEKKDKLTEAKLGRRARPSAASDRAVLLDQNQPSAAADRAESVDQNQPSTSAALDRAVLVDQNQPSTSAAADRAESVFQNQPSTSAALDKAESVDQVQQSPTESEFMEQDVSDAACDSNVLLNDLLDVDLTDGNTDLINDLLNAEPTRILQI